MINMMNTEALTTGIGLTIAVITLGITIYLTNKSTQKLLERIDNSINRIVRIQEDTHMCLIKIDKGLMANALMHGWRREDNITSEDIDGLPEPKVFDKELGFCYYKPKSE